MTDLEVWPRIRIMPVLYSVVDVGRVAEGTMGDGEVESDNVSLFSTGKGLVIFT